MYYQKENDETLVMLTLAGEQSAYEVLVIRYQKAVIASALSVTRNQFMAEDAAQDAFVTAWMKLDTLQDGAKFSPWVCRIAKNCALNMVMRFKSYMPLASVENLNIHDNPALNPAELYVLSEEKEEIYKSTAKLPQKVKEIIHLHYFDGLSIAEIAERMRISEGTVKWQLHDGRKRIRKELCAMNEKYSDTLVQRVMKKVEELKLWQFKNDKSGFEVVYKTVLKDVEDLPESRDKSHALADVLMRGWWWLPGEKNDALFARISEAALEGKNEEAMTFIVAREDSKVWGSAKIDFIRDKQIPRLEKAGFMQALGREWFWLGYHYFREGKAKEGHAAYDKVCEVLKPSDSYYTLIPYARKMEAVLENEYKDESEKRYRIGSNADEFRYFDGTLRFWSNEGFGEGYMHSVDSDIMRIFRNSCLCDGQFFADIKTGESYIGSDGTTLTYASDCETVESPAGVFKDCRVWITKHFNWSGKSIFKSYYKEGVGIVKHEHIQDGLYDVRLLSSYHITGGDGLLPMAYGNRWEYISKYATDIMTAELTFDVSYADKNKVVLTSWKNITRHKYDENLWLDMIQQIRSDYCEEINGSQKLCDVYHAVERAGALAKAPMEQAHTKAASSVVRRILATDPVFNPNHTATGHWNFFSKVFVRKKKDTISITYNRRWSFEWKNTGSMGHAEEPILYNDIYGILQDATNCIWSEEWRIGASPMIEYNPYDMTIQTKITCENGGTITTKAGTFENCLKLSLDIGGMTDGLSYRGGKKVYYFAEGIGIVRTENEYGGGARTAVYELSTYEGTGEGFMPLADGLLRKYDALDLTDGFVGAAEYTYVADDDGDIVIFADRTGIRELPPPITQYSAIQGEVIEDHLWNEGKRNESRLCHDVNNFHILTHFLGRPHRYWSAQEKAVAWNKYKMKIMEGLGENEEVPTAWMGHYSSTCFRIACALFGCGKKDEGYIYLEKAFELFPKWEKITDGEEMDVGNPLIYGGIKVLKGKGIVKLPDGRTELISYGHLFEDKVSLMYYGMTAPKGWEWFNSVRNEDRFKEYVERAKALL